MLVNLKGIFTLQHVAMALKALPELATTVMDLVFPERPTHPSPLIGKSELTAVTGTMPVVRRNGAPVAMASEGLQIDYLAPQPLKPSVDVSAAELNDLRAMMGDQVSLEAWRNSKVDALRRLVRNTTEAMAATVLTTGKLAWPCKLDGGGYDTYEIDYGPILSFVPGKKWNADPAPGIDEVFEHLASMEQAVQEAGVGSTVKFLAGKTAFAALLKLVKGWTSTAAGQPISVTLEKGTIDIGGYEVKRLGERYQDPQNGAWTAKVPDGAVIGYATDAPGKVFYLSLDSISANLRAVPFHVFPAELKDDSGIRLIGQSKPLPARSSKTLIKATVIV